MPTRSPHVLLEKPVYAVKFVAERKYQGRKFFTGPYTSLELDEYMDGGWHPDPNCEYKTVDHMKLPIPCERGWHALPFTYLHSRSYGMVGVATPWLVQLRGEMRAASGKITAQEIRFVRALTPREMTVLMNASARSWAPLSTRAVPLSGADVRRTLGLPRSARLAWKCKYKELERRSVGWSIYTRGFFELEVRR